MDYKTDLEWIWEKIKHEFKGILPDLKGDATENITEVAFNRDHGITQSIQFYLKAEFPEYAELVGIK